jgi:hypothetical protein
MTSYPDPDGPAAGSASAELGKQLALTDFVILDPPLLSLDRVSTHEAVGNGAVDFVGTFTLVVGRDNRR